VKEHYEGEIVDAARNDKCAYNYSTTTESDSNQVSPHMADPLPHESQNLETAWITKLYSYNGIAVCNLSYSYDYKEQRVLLQNIHKPTYNIHGKQKTEVKQVYNPF